MSDNSEPSFFGCLFGFMFLATVGVLFIKVIWSWFKWIWSFW